MGDGQWAMSDGRRVSMFYWRFDTFDLRPLRRVDLSLLLITLVFRSIVDRLVRRSIGLVCESSRYCLAFD
jgi:hypothetical protein